MRTSFPTRDQLSAMSIALLRVVDIQEKDEEELVQEILNSKIKMSPPQKEVKVSDIPDIKTPEEEAKWQKIVDERAAKMKGVVEDLVEDLPTDHSDDAPVAPDEPPKEDPKEEKPFCSFCDSKGGRHKKDCPTLVVV